MFSSLNATFNVNNELIKLVMYNLHLLSYCHCVNNELIKLVMYNLHLIFTQLLSLLMMFYFYSKCKLKSHNV